MRTIKIGPVTVFLDVYTLQDKFKTNSFLRCPEDH